VNGLLAAIFWTSTVVSPQGSIVDSFSVRPADEFRGWSYSALEYQKEFVGIETQFDIGHDFSNGPLQRITSMSLTDDLGAWLGHGFYNEIGISEKYSLGFTFLPGVYHQADEVDLGGWIMFRSGVQLNYQVLDNFYLAISYDHRSSGDIWTFNPGLETWQIKFRTYI
tara:strand:- start:268 stop:768 length:501 start_codon:yes stop_codon:yes gene_type:complete